MSRVECPGRKASLLNDARVALCTCLLVVAVLAASLSNRTAEAALRATAPASAPVGPSLVAMPARYEPRQDETPTAVPEAPDTLPGWIAYTRRADEDFVWEVFRAKADGSQDRGMTSHALAGKGADAPRWSPDGRWLLYATTDKSGEVVTLWRMAEAGGTPSPLATVRAAQAGAGSVGPDSASIAFVGAAASGPSTTDLLVRAADGRARGLVTTSDRDEDMPDWSARTGQVVFSAKTIDGPAASRAWDLFVIQGDGGEATLVSGQEGVSECSPRWSPDGRQVVYLAVSGQTCFGAGTLRILDLSSGEDRPVIGGASIQAAWSPDGLWLLAYNTYNGGLYPPGGPTPPPAARQQLKGLYVVKVDDGSLYRLRGAAGGAGAKDGSYLWGQVADWTGGTPVPRPEATVTPSATATTEPSPTVATASPTTTEAPSTTPNPSPTPELGASPSATEALLPTRATPADPAIYLPLALRNAPVTVSRNRR